MIRQRNRIGIWLRITGITSRIKNKGRKNVNVEWKNYKLINGIGLYRIKIKKIMTIKSVTVIKELM